MSYSSVTHRLKQPIEAADYQVCSDFIVDKIETIIQQAMNSGNNKIIINTNLKRGIPMENVNKIAGPFVEAWAYETFVDAFNGNSNQYDLINVETGARLDMADIILQFKKKRSRSSSVAGHVDVKATSKDIKNSGKSPNITSYARIRSAYVEDPDYIFIVLSIKHQVSSTKDPKTNMMMGIMEAVDFNAYDLKFISDRDISYNPALGTGQLQIRDIHYVSKQIRSTWDFCQLLDQKYIASKKGFVEWSTLANKKEWII